MLATGPRDRRDTCDGDVGSALVLSEACRFARQVPLADLRASRCMDRPPQSYSYIEATTGDQLLRISA